MRWQRWSCCVLLPLLLCLDHTATCAPTAGGPVNLGKKTLDSFLDSLPPDTIVLMEYYAHWCPSCQAFQPTYEKIAQFFNAEPRPQPEVIVARIDCAEEGPLCSAASIRSYPTMKVGKPAWFKKDSPTFPKTFNSGSRSVEAIVKFVGDEAETEYHYTEGKTQEAALKVTGVSDSGNHTLASQMDTVDIDSATILAFRYMFDSSSELLKGAHSRAALASFVRLLADSHPSDRCRAGAKAMHQQLPMTWPERVSERVSEQPEDALKEMHVCGADAQPQEWRDCKGSKEGMRGYTCGLWQLLHSLAARIQDEDKGGGLWMQAVRGFVHHFFQCSDCASHFVGMAGEPEALAVQSRRDAVLWMWQAHNRVNKRLQEHEANANDGDSAFPKMQWPPSELCALCRMPTLAPENGVSWNVDEVFRFLVKFYGGSLPSVLAQEQHLQLVATTAAGGRKHMGAFQPARRRSWLLDLGLVAGAATLVFSIMRWRSWWHSFREDGTWES